MEWSLDAIESSLRLAFEEGYNDRYTFTLTDNKLSVDDLHLGVNVCTIEPYGEGYILHPHEETVDAIVLDGTSESPWLGANQFVDLYDTEHPVPQEKYIAYLEHKVEQLEASLAEKQGELVAMDILKTNKDTELAVLKEENARLISERDSLFHDTEAYKQVIRYQDDQLRNMKQDRLRKSRQIAMYAENYYGAMARLQHHNDLATEKNKNYLAISDKWTDVKERIEALLR